MQKRGDRDRPAVTRLAENLRLRHDDVLKEDLVELRVACDLHQRPDLDTRALHVHQQVRQTVTRIRLFALAGDEHAPLRDLRQRRPDLLAIDHVVIAFVLGSGLQAREVAARVGLAEALAPDLVACQQGPQVTLLLLFGTVGDHDRPAHAETDDVDRFRGISSLKISCSMKPAPRPPYSLGHVMPT